MLTEIGARRIVDPKGWATTVREAMKAAEGRIPLAAKTLGVSSRQLHRWLALPELASVPRVPQGVRQHPENNGRSKRKNT